MIKEAVVLGLNFFNRERLREDRLKEAVKEKALELAQSGVWAKTKYSDQYTVFSADGKGYFFKSEVWPGFPLVNGQVFFITKLDLDNFARGKLFLLSDSNGLVVSYGDKNRHGSHRWRKFAEDFLRSQLDLGKTEEFWYWINRDHENEVVSGDLSLKYLAAKRPILKLVR